jgi:hypothetical protein
MSTEIIHKPTPAQADLLAKREELAAIRTTLAEHEVDLADLRVKLRAFESRYMQQVGTLYATLDDWEARIAEREVDLYDSDEARKHAAEARQRANETHNAAYADDVIAEPEDFDPPPSLKQLFRELAKRIHPDFARDDAEQAHFTRLMTRANTAYNRGDANTLQRLLDDHHETTTVEGKGATAELNRITRQIAHARRDIHALDDEQAALLSSEIAHLQHDAEAATLTGRDLLAELASGLREKLSEAEYRFNFINRQVAAQR